MDRDFFELVTPVVLLLSLGMLVGFGLSAIMTWSLLCAVAAGAAFLLSVIATLTMYLLSI